MGGEALGVVAGVRRVCAGGGVVVGVYRGELALLGRGVSAVVCRGVRVGVGGGELAGEV